jgi:hypothetical protein
MDRAMTMDPCELSRGCVRPAGHQGYCRDSGGAVEPSREDRPRADPQTQPLQYMVEECTLLQARAVELAAALQWAIGWIRGCAEVPVAGTDEQDDRDYFDAAVRLLAAAGEGEEPRCEHCGGTRTLEGSGGTVIVCPTCSGHLMSGSRLAADREN